MRLKGVDDNQTVHLAGDHQIRCLGESEVGGAHDRRAHQLFNGGRLVAGFVEREQIVTCDDSGSTATLIDDHDRSRPPLTHRATCGLNRRLRGTYDDCTAHHILNTPSLDRGPIERRDQV